MSNLHQVVVDDIGQMVSRQLVGTLIEHLVVDDVALDAHFAANEVVDEHLLAGLNLEAHDILMTRSHQRLDLFLGKSQ